MKEKCNFSSALPSLLMNLLAHLINEHLVPKVGLILSLAFAYVFTLTEQETVALASWNPLDNKTRSKHISPGPSL